jgi:hypothetical protein
MAKFTNRQLDLLSESIVERLKEEHEAKHAELLESDEYVNFEKNYIEQTPALKEAQSKIDQAKALEERIDELKTQIKMLETEAGAALKKGGFSVTETASWGGTRYLSPEHALRAATKHAKREKFKESNFDFEKMLRKVQAEILLGDVTDAKQILEQMVQKFSPENNT